MAGSDIFAAGGIVWRTIDGVPHVGIVHRPRYGGDISLPKGKLEVGETLRQCAMREVAEELGVTVSTGLFAAATTYRKGSSDKYVLFWEMRWIADCDDGPDGVEVTGRQWLTGSQALAALSYDTERTILARVIDGQP